MVVALSSFQVVLGGGGGIGSGGTGGGDGAGKLRTTKVNVVDGVFGGGGGWYERIAKTGRLCLLINHTNLVSVSIQESITGMSLPSLYEIRYPSNKSVIVIKADFSRSYIVFKPSCDNIQVPHVYPTALTEDKSIIIFREIRK